MQLAPTPVLTSKVYDVADFAAVQEFYHSKGWTDGLPVVPPTAAAVEACLAWVQSRMEVSGRRDAEACRRSGQG